MNNTDVEIKVGVNPMNIFTDKQLAKLYANGKSDEKDNIPVAYLVQSTLNYQWLVTELYEHDLNLAYGLYYLNDELPKVGYFPLSTIYDLNCTANTVFNNPSFAPSDRLSVFFAVAQECGYIAVQEELNAEVFQRYRKLIV